MDNDITFLAKKAKEKSFSLASSSIDERNFLLNTIAEFLSSSKEDILTANAADLTEAKQNNLSAVMLKRLELTAAKIDDMIKGVLQVASLPDPLGKVQLNRALDEDLILTRLSVPIGLLGVIFEARPEAFIQIATLALKSGNCAILKGGKEATRSNETLFKIVTSAIAKTDSHFGKSIFEGVVVLATTRDQIDSLLKLDTVIDLMIPRGSNALVKYIKENTKIAVLGHADGICHFYVDDEVDINQAINLVVDAKTQYPAVCNAIETLLVHANVATNFLPLLNEALTNLPNHDGKSVELRGCEKCAKIIACESATDEDWKTEYDDLILSVKIVENIDEAISHINCYGSHHSDAIATTSETKASYFASLVDSSSVMVNASTRFADGFRYGFGAEVGISTAKIHARGPVGLEGLTIYKYLLKGNGNVVSDYASGAKKFLHKDLV